MSTVHDYAKAWHNQSVDQTLHTLSATVNGLSDTQAASRLKKFGKNEIPKQKKEQTLVRFLRQFNSVLIYVLLLAMLVTATLNHWVDSIVIAAVVLINACIGFIQEGKAEQALAAISHLLALQANVLREGKRKTLDTENLVVGDVVFLEPGDKVPADLRLIEAHSLQVQEASLTGESAPVEKQTSAIDENTALAERTCMVYSGTIVSDGQAKGVVVATGRYTEIGKITQLLEKVTTLTTPLIKQMNRFSRWLSGVILFFAILIMGYGHFIGNLNFDEIFMIVIGFVVAAIPEGLPAILTITLSVGVQAMAKKHAIVRKLPAIETLGSVSVICSDKTGTLTRNEMMVAAITTATEKYSVSGQGYQTQGNINTQITSPNLNNEALSATLVSSVLCNSASLYERNGTWQVHGDPMEGALLVLALKGGYSHESVMLDWEPLDIVPFRTEYRYMATLCKNRNQNRIFIKGAPEVIFALCRNQLTANGEKVAFNQNFWQKSLEELASQGMRVIAFAQNTNSKNTIAREDINQSLTFVSLVGLIDPPREESKQAIQACYNAGIAVKMITGDHPLTAGYIAKEIGIKNAQKLLIGDQIDAMTDNELKIQVAQCHVFSRTTPEHKLRLVQALQSDNRIVAMTGDGVNDAPALKRADIGIAMGKSGTQAAKEAADFVLTDDNFATIVDAVREGRTVYDNIRKVISWTLPTNAGEAMIIVCALLFFLEQPITPLQILWVNMITAVTLGIALAFEPTEENTMKRSPRRRQEPLLDLQLFWHIVFIAFLFVVAVFSHYQYAVTKNYSIELARTIAMNTLVVLEIFHLFFIRNIYGTSITIKGILGTKVIWVTIAVVTVAQFFISYTPICQKIFQTQAVPFLDGVLIILTGLVFFLIIEVEKQSRLRFLGWKKNA